MEYIQYATWAGAIICSHLSCYYLGAAHGIREARKIFNRIFANEAKNDQ